MEMDLWYWLVVREMVPEGDPAAELLRDAQRAQVAGAGDGWVAVAPAAGPRASPRSPRLGAARARDEQTPAA
jgi:hypothetical protein